MMRAKMVCALVVLASSTLLAGEKAGTENPSIDMSAYLRSASSAAEIRAGRRLTEDEFIGMMNQPGIIILDARSRAKFDELHVKGAVNLSFPDITAASLAQLIPAKDSAVLIYCNNNFTNNESAFPTKAPAASLNLSTFIALYTYGYRNVYELGPLLDIRKARIPFASNIEKRADATP